MSKSFILNVNLDLDDDVKISDLINVFEENMILDQSIKRTVSFGKGNLKNETTKHKKKVTLKFRIDHYHSYYDDSMDFVKKYLDDFFMALKTKKMSNKTEYCPKTNQTYIVPISEKEFEKKQKAKNKFLGTILEPSDANNLMLFE